MSERDRENNTTIYSSEVARQPVFRDTEWTLQVLQAPCLNMHVRASIYSRHSHSVDNNWFGKDTVVRL